MLHTVTTLAVDPVEFIAALFNACEVASVHPAVLDEEFVELDVDHDGVITAADLVAASRCALVLLLPLLPCLYLRTG